ncbi:ATPase [Yinghuangia sp. KLBMP8922]|uniref:ATPase n=1 Tax=Yinghuangia soli TaxID=2908204 RepID=A0AA41U2Z2_9ACTN|nr:ATPase [Yinghuangia soli]
MLALDAGNSKTDVAVADVAGTVLATVRGPGFQPHRYGLAEAVSRLDRLVVRALGVAGRPAPVRHAAVCAANADLPVEEHRLQEEIGTRGWAASVAVANDTFAVLRSCTAAADAVAIVCGAGINCVGRNRDGRTVRFPALGRITGDWGGGAGLAEEVLWWSVRAEDGRGPHTALAAAVASHFGRGTATDVALDLHLEVLAGDRVHEAVPLLFAVAEGGDAVARRIVDRQAEEIAALAVSALTRLDLAGPEGPEADRPVDVALGGGVLAARPEQLLTGIRTRIAAHTSHARLRIADVPPIAGAVLLALDQLAAAAEPGAAGAAVSAAAESRVRDAFRPAAAAGTGGA